MDQKSKHILLCIFTTGLSALFIVLTLKYVLKAGPVFKVLALIVNALMIYLTYITFKNKPDVE